MNKMHEDAEDILRIANSLNAIKYKNRYAASFLESAEVLLRHAAKVANKTEEFDKYRTEKR